MGRLIYEDDIRKVVEKYLDADDSNGSDVAMDILSDISGLPPAQTEISCSEIPNNCSAADIVPVVHGEWADNNDIWLCSKCGKWIDILQGDADMNFCPNCGSDNRGEEK